MKQLQTAEHRRLTDSEAREADCKNWGPYLSERAWGTIREDCSPDGQAWEFFPHDHAEAALTAGMKTGWVGLAIAFKISTWP